MHHKFVRDPVYNLPNVSACLDVAVRRVPEDWYKAPSGALLRLEVVAKLNDIVLDIIQFRVSCSYDCVTGELRDPGTTVGGLGSEGDKTVIPGPKCWNPISSSKCIVLARQD